VIVRVSSATRRIGASEFAGCYDFAAASVVSHVEFGEGIGGSQRQPADFSFIYFLDSQALSTSTPRAC
jgi:hypothetical protein